MSLLPKHSIISLYTRAWLHLQMCELTFTSLYYPLSSCMDGILVPLESRYWLLTTQTGTWCPSSHHSRILQFASTHLLICSPSISFRLYPFSCLCLLFPIPIYPSSSPSFPSPLLLARWLVYHWDGCGIKDATLFFFRSFSASLSPQSNFSVFPLRSL